MALMALILLIVNGDEPDPYGRRIYEQGGGFVLIAGCFSQKDHSASRRADESSIRISTTGSGAAGDTRQEKAMDAKAGEPPFIIDLIIDRGNRRTKLAGVLKALFKTIIIATVFDMIAQYLIFDQVRVIPAIIVGVFVLTAPYSLARG